VQPNGAFGAWRIVTYSAPIPRKVGSIVPRQPTIFGKTGINHQSKTAAQLGSVGGDAVRCATEGSRLAAVELKQFE
jgi:hypothetical protein